MLGLQDNTALIPLGLLATITDSTIPLSQSSLITGSQMGKENKFEGFTLRNTATLSLNGSHQEVQQNHLNFTGYLRAWCCGQGHRADVSRLFDRECVMYTTPESGTFYPVIAYEGRSLVFVIDGRNLYIKGFAGPNRSYQLSLDEQKENYMLQEDLEILDFHANYHDIAPGHDVGHTLLGLHPLRKAFDCLWAHKGGKPHPKFRQSIAMISVYICEAARLQPVLHCASTSLVDDNMSRLNKMSQLSKCVTSWKFLSREIMTHINYLMAGQTPPQFNNRGMSRYSSIQDLFLEVRILFRDAGPQVPSLNGDQCPFHDQNPQQYPVFASPVDPGLGDPNIDVSFTKPGVQSLYSHNHQSGRKRQNEYQCQKSGKRKKPLLELEETIRAARRKFYMGGGVGGPVANIPPFFVEPWAPKLTVSKEQKKPASPKSAKSPFSSGQKRNLSYSPSHGSKAMIMPWERPNSWTQKLKMSQQCTPFLCKPKFSGGPFSMTMPHVCGEKMGMGSVCNFQVGERAQPWKMDWIGTGSLIGSNKCNVLKWYNDNRHGTTYSGHAKMVATPKSFLQTVKPRCSWFFYRVARLLH